MNVWPVAYHRWYIERMQNPKPDGLNQASVGRNCSPCGNHAGLHIKQAKPTFEVHELKRQLAHDLFPISKLSKMSKF